MEAIHSKKPMREKDSSPRYTLAQFHKLQTKEYFNFWIFNSPPLKANLFLSLQTVQKIHNGMDFQIFFLFFPTNEPLQEIKVSFTVSGRTHLTSINPKIIFHRALVTIQCKRIWFTFSSSQPHKKQQLGSCTPLNWSLSRVSTFPHVASQAKKQTLVGTLSTHILLAGNTVALGLCKCCYVPYGILLSCTPLTLLFSTHIWFSLCIITLYAHNLYTHYPRA